MRHIYLWKVRRKLRTTTVILLFLQLAGCTWFFGTDGSGDGTIVDEIVQPWGTVIDAKTGLGISGAEVSLASTEISTLVFIVTAGAGGSFDYADVDDAEKPDYGEYILTASMDGYVFAERHVSVSGIDQDLGQIIGFAYDADLDSGTLTIATVWDDGFDDVDVHITYPDGWRGQYDFIHPYSESLSYDGFEPHTSGRETVYWKEKGSRCDLDDVGFTGDYRACVELDVDDRNGAGPETLSIRAIPFDWYSRNPVFDIDGGGATQLPIGYSYAWIGVMQLYVHGFSDALQDEGEYLGAEVEIYVFSDDQFEGLYLLPRYTNINAASVLRINLFARDDNVDFYQITPDLRVLNQYSPDDDIPAFKGIPRSDILNVAGGKR
jgi:hypothetical protein